MLLQYQCKSFPPIELGELVLKLVWKQKKGQESQNYSGEEKMGRLTLSGIKTYYKALLIHALVVLWDTNGIEWKARNIY